ncbi:rhodanese-like domain-containing protein [Chitinophaga sp. Cy-1792]|uniref:rhodanese-like domain-containing protein n=1 Tax=Chitinophaga sp. Cy-1792 TaxID=2608339 RepID=UPI0014209659|nr:rhodanese-like domain-containing protein [Chitinophaga sp. Cy-1792]NIG54801.1 rhodanese-like domain-containing protein [Chitinophaga sp. Cy-1792]
MKTIVIIIGVLVVLYGSYRMYRFINLDKGLHVLVAKGAIVLDVRTVVEFNIGHIAGAVNIPLGQLHADSLPLDKNKIYITVCSHGLRSVKAMHLLKAKGYTVYNGGALPDLQAELDQIQPGR